MELEDLLAAVQEYDYSSLSNISYLYLASPYTHNNPKVQDSRCEAVVIATRTLLVRKIKVFSPIVHGMPIFQDPSVPRDFEFWKDLSLCMVANCKNFAILELEGWEVSVGVQAELELAKTLQKTTFRIHPETLGLNAKYPHVSKPENIHAGFRYEDY